MYSARPSFGNELPNLHEPPTAPNAAPRVHVTRETSRCGADRKTLNAYQYLPKYLVAIGYKLKGQACMQPQASGNTSDEENAVGACTMRCQSISFTVQTNVAQRMQGGMSRLVAT
ncbi:uncharacterized protein ColSpa_03579 [Colletotrichum spaethianum]|uniref:Uncharacterized protein n=1 Tax=Colletotrichum spaethianum TaxID=700344 RepID=A0AA37LBS4_9PEZI|nr:uncharacterized protein ColSpa_03579 [Colletotrichum spaethianum]GKT43398.1 hypothetical protein ColSpa_03579 [Colletotrichum spaethianum]